jgi:hypothetical protein
MDAAARIERIESAARVSDDAPSAAPSCRS